MPGAFKTSGSSRATASPAAVSSSGPRPKVFIVDDDQAVRDSMCYLLDSVGLRAQAFSSARQFLDQYSPEQPGCLVLDVRLPGMSGLELQEKLAAQGVSLPIIILTGHGDVPIAVRAMKAGALDFIEKPFNDQLLLERVRQAIDLDARRRAQYAERQQVMAHFASLTPREREVMRLVVSGRLNKQIAQQLGLSSKTVEVHRAHVMTKMHADSLASLVKMAMLLEPDGQQ